jgi:deazaflavin-dependent oxidoreductase (nitroreductase family)
MAEPVDPLGAELAAEGRAAILVTRGRRTGRPVATPIGFVASADGSLLVAAGDPGADWARNLLADPRCEVVIGDERRPCWAEELSGPERAAAIRELILKYGTPAERLGWGPAFRLRPEGS